MLRRRSRFLLLAILVGLLICGCDSSKKEPTELENEGFAIYLLAQDISYEQISHDSLDGLELGRRLISVNDIVAYYRNTHEIEFTDDAMSKIYARNHGQPFVVCVDSDRIYSGVFWSPTSNLLIPGPKIYTFNAIPPYWKPIRIHYVAFPNEIDPRSDPRILESLEQAGKLK